MHGAIAIKGRRLTFLAFPDGFGRAAIRDGPRGGLSLESSVSKPGYTSINSVQMPYLEGHALLLTVVSYHLNNRKMSAIEESATTYRRRSHVVTDR